MAMEAAAQDNAAKKLTRNQVAWRAANEIPDGSYVNLGIGLPTTCANFMPEDREIVLHSENGILGVGPAPEPGTENPELIRIRNFRPASAARWIWLPVPSRFGS